MKNNLIMNKKICVFLTCVLMTGFVAAENSFGRYAGIIGGASGEAKIIKEFSEYAAAGDIDGAMQLMTSAIRGNEALVESDFTNRVFPFFRDYSEIHNAKTIGSSIFPDRSRGTTHYVYIVTSSGEKKPFLVSFRKEQGRPVILGLDVDKCVSGRHPSCDGDTEVEADQEY